MKKSWLGWLIICIFVDLARSLCKENCKDDEYCDDKANKCVKCGPCFNLYKKNTDLTKKKINDGLEAVLDKYELERVEDLCKELDGIWKRKEDKIEFNKALKDADELLKKVDGISKDLNKLFPIVNYKPILEEYKKETPSLKQVEDIKQNLLKLKQLLDSIKLDKDFVNPLDIPFLTESGIKDLDLLFVEEKVDFSQVYDNLKKFILSLKGLDFDLPSTEKLNSLSKDIGKLSDNISQEVKRIIKNEKVLRELKEILQEVLHIWQDILYAYKLFDEIKEMGRPLTLQQLIDKYESSPGDGDFDPEPILREISYYNSNIEKKLDICLKNEVI